MLNQWIGWNAFTQIFEIIKGRIDWVPGIWLVLQISSKEFNRGVEWISFISCGEVTIYNVWDTISSIYQSNWCGLNTETFYLGVTFVKLLVGQWRARMFNNFKDQSFAKRGIITIDNHDSRRLSRVLVIAIVYVEDDAEYRKICCNIGKFKDIWHY